MRKAGRYPGGTQEPGKTPWRWGVKTGLPLAIQRWREATRLGIRTTIGPMTGLPRQRRLKWIETLKNASITCMAGCKEAFNSMN